MILLSWTKIISIRRNRKYRHIERSLVLQDAVDVKENFAGTRVGGKSFEQESGRRRA